MLLVEQIERRVIGERQVAATLIAGGAKKVELPDIDEAIDAFDQALAAEPKRVRSRDAAVLEALGVRRAG